ncbi:MAG TPA: DMT family transporter [Sporichthyaceae bacterium]|nr:DMT family transporter [Sporichthyaceae bacterium]
MTAAAVPVALVAAALFALSWAAQHVAARREDQYEVLDPRLLVRLCRRPLWLAGRLAATAGVGVQFWALRLGPLSVVAPLMVLGLVIAVPLESLIERRRPDPGELRAVALTGAGIALFLEAAKPHRAHANPSWAAWSVVFAVAAVVVVAAGALHLAVPRWSAVSLAIATGTLFGVAAALLKAAATRASSPGSLLADPRLYLYIAVSIVALILTQNAFQRGRLSTPLVAITLCEPVTALFIGVLAFDEHLRMGPIRVTAAAFGAAAIVLGVRNLTTSMATEHARAVPGPTGKARTAP